MKKKNQDAEIRNLLEAEQHRIHRTLETLQHDAGPQGPRSADIVEIACDTTELYNITARRTCLETELTEIEEALSRMNDGVYRICRQCGFLIDQGRLDAYPFATLCIECKRKEEKKVRKCSNSNSW